MAFKRRARSVIELEFITVDDKTLKYDVPYSQELADTLIKIGEEMDNAEDLSVEEQKQYLIKAYEELLGKEAMAEIKEKVFGGDELEITDLVDIGLYITSVVEKKNTEMEERTKDLANVTNVETNVQAPQKMFTIEEVQRLLNEETNKLSH